MIEKPPKISLHSVMSYINKPEIISEIKSINNSYLYWDKVKYKKVGNLSAEKLWSLVKITREVNYKNINFGNIVFKYFSTDYIQKKLHYLDLNIGGYIGTKDIISEHEKSRILINSIMEEAIFSSKIEGANTTRKKAKEMLEKEQKPKDKSELMIYNNYKTIKHLVKYKNQDLSIENLKEIHKLITKDTLDNKNDEGEYRKNNDVTVVDYIKGKVVHYPPDFMEMEKLIEDLCIFFNEDDQDNFIHPLIKGIVIHFMIGYIHPFVDGNGRTARTLFYWYLLKKGYWLSEYISISKIIQDSKNKYEKAYLYTENDNNDLSYFITYNLEVMEDAFKDLKEYISLKQKENLLIANFIKIPNINERQAEILKILNDDKERIFTVKSIENRYNISNYTARTDLNSLVQLGYLEVIQVNKKQQNFIRSKNFKILLEKYFK